MRFILALYCLILTHALTAQTGIRTIINFNSNWEFRKDTAGNKESWQPISLPHTWNKEDVLDDIPGYYRGSSWYRKNFTVKDVPAGKEVFLYFEGANQVAEVFINGQKAATHIGGYNGFYVSVTKWLHNTGENELLVKVDNSANENVPPLSADFTFYGGIYRDVWLMIIDPVHFELNEYGANAVMISTPVVNEKMATVAIAITINCPDGGRNLKLVSTIYDKAGKPISANAISSALSPGTCRTIIKQQLEINNPSLWSPDRPYLYKVVTSISDAQTGQLLDQVTNPLGLRWFRFDAASGFYLNGKHLNLIGTSRHQDYKGMGNAVPDELARKDVQLIKEMGGNFLRVAHYPQDPSVLAACDSLGILASVEIPIVNEITESQEFYDNCLRMQKEMIQQHYNHPSAIIWCYMNEVLLRTHYASDKERRVQYLGAITKLAASLDSLTRKEDPYRYTMMAHHGDYDKYNNAGLVTIPMIVGWNLYSGWYGANKQDFPAFLDSFHKKNPDKPMVVSEFGADADPRIRSTAPVRFDKSVEYTTAFHQYYFSEMMKRPFVAASMIWNLADFNSETRTESMPHINNKGLMEWDRTPKDPYFFYKAVLSTKSFVKLLHTEPAAGMADSGRQYSWRIVQAATNLKQAELIVNGKSAGIKSTINGICEWRIPFENGVNKIEVVAKMGHERYNDKADIQFCVTPTKLNNGQKGFQDMNILLGANRYFTDQQHRIWIPDQVYQPGSWGHSGGHMFTVPGNSRLPYGTDKNILTTVDDPIYQTQQMGIEQYRLDVPAGEYELTLHFCELLGGKVDELPYNLSDPDRIEPNGKRIFNVVANGKLVLDHFNIAAEYGSSTAVTKTIQVTVQDDKGIELDFSSVEGEPVLNALQVRKIQIVQPVSAVSTGK